MYEEFQKFFNEKIINIRNLNHKGNNKLYQVSTFKQKFLLKKYSTIQKDNWNRGETEFRTLINLWAKGFREIPKPISFHEKENMGIYSFEEGRILKSEEIKEKDILKAASFLAKIHNLEIEEKIRFPLERTACICILDYLKLIENRIKNISEDFAADQDVKFFWDNVIVKKAQELKEFILKNEKINLNKKLSLGEQVITPGDFGFHNILVNNDKYIFLDFEFCGRDDPAKQILDFLHHDRSIKISRELKQLFLDKYRKSVNHPEDFETRLRTIDLLIGMNWALIYLNPLSKTYQKHMQFSGRTNLKEVIEQRILKAEEKLKNLSFFKD